MVRAAGGLDEDGVQVVRSGQTWDVFFFFSEKRKESHLLTRKGAGRLGEGCRERKCGLYS